MISVCNMDVEEDNWRDEKHNPISQDLLLFWLKVHLVISGGGCSLPLPCVLPYVDQRFCYCTLKSHLLPLGGANSAAAKHSALPQMGNCFDSLTINISISHQESIKPQNLSLR